MREKLVRSDMLECVIGLGPNLFYNSPMEACILDRTNYEQLMSENTEFFELINSGQFVYTGCVVCINDPLYIEKNRFSQRSDYELTIYARENVNECCLAFDRTFCQDDS